MQNQKIKINININNKDFTFSVFPMTRLIDVLRNEAGFTGTKEGCGEGECGSCMVLLNNTLVNSCLIPAIQINSSKITTIEGLYNTRIFKALEKAFISKGGTQCGFCTPGMIMASYDLLAKNKKPSKDQIKLALSGNLCRCTGYSKITQSVISAISSIGGNV